MSTGHQNWNVSGGAAMLDPSVVREVDFYLADPKEGSRKGLASMLRNMGLRHIKAFDSADKLAYGLKGRCPDALLVSADLHDDIFKMVKTVRDQDLGDNPFTVISVVIDQDNKQELTSALKAGADDVLPGSPSPSQVMERLEKVALNRLPFIASPDYIGPDRRQKDERSTPMPIFNVLNTLKDKIEGRPCSMAMIHKAVAEQMHEVRAAQLEGISQKLGHLCKSIIKAYDMQKPQNEIDKVLGVLRRSLNKAAVTATKGQELSLAEICTGFAKKIEEVCSEDNRPTDQELKLLKTLTRAYQMARENISGATTPH